MKVEGLRTKVLRTIAGSRSGLSIYDFAEGKVPWEGKRPWANTIKKVLDSFNREGLVRVARKSTEVPKYRRKPYVITDVGGAILSILDQIGSNKMDEKEAREKFPEDVLEKAVRAGVLVWRVKTNKVLEMGIMTGSYSSEGSEHAGYYDYATALKVRKKLQEVSDILDKSLPKRTVLATGEGKVKISDLSRADRRRLRTALAFTRLGEELLSHVVLEADRLSADELTRLMPYLSRPFVNVSVEGKEVVIRLVNGWKVFAEMK